MSIIEFFAGYYLGLYLFIPVILFFAICAASSGKR